MADKVGLGLERSLKEDGCEDRPLGLGSHAGVVLGLLRPDHLELVQVHLARGPAAPDALLRRVEGREVGTESRAAGGGHRKREIGDALFDGTGFLVVPISGLTVAEKAAALSHVVERAAHLNGLETASDRLGSEAIGEELGLPMARIAFPRRVQRSVDRLEVTVDGGVV